MVKDLGALYWGLGLGLTEKEMIEEIVKSQKEVEQ